MNSNLFERKNFLDGTWMRTNIDNYFSLETYSQNSVLKVNLLRATANESDALKKFLKKMSSHISENLIIDLSETSFIDSTFLSSIISYGNRNKYKIKLIVADRRQLAIFKITKIDSLFSIYSSLDQALTS
jgi:anti-anti-sigma regulatory factor